MPEQNKTAWAVEYVDNGRRILSNGHSTPEEAKKAFEDSMGIAWKELERRGARIFQLEISEHPSDPPRS